MENSNKAINQVGSFLVGSLIGGILGILFAPRKGSDTRQAILDSGENISETVKDKYGNLVKMVNQEISDVKNMASEAIDHNLAKIEKAKNNLSA
jgi:gas vesicle protein